MKRNPIYKELVTYPIDYALLIVGLLVLTVLFLFFQAYQYAQWAVGIAVGLSYITWGILHHHRSQMLTKHVIKEYVFAGLLASVLLILLTL